MKLFSFSFLYLILIILFLISENLSLKHRVHHKAHKFTKKHKNHVKKETLAPFFFRFMEKNLLSQNESTETDTSESSQNQTSSGNSSVLILKEGWLRISSQSLYVRK